MWDKALPYDPVGGAVADTEREILGYAMEDEFLRTTKSRTVTTSLTS